MVKVSYRIRGPMALWQRQNEPLEAAVLDAGINGLCVMPNRRLNRGDIHHPAPRSGDLFHLRARSEDRRLAGNTLSE